MNVVIIGAGNLGIVCAARMAAKGIAVTMLTGFPEKWTNRAAADDCGMRLIDRVLGQLAKLKLKRCVIVTGIV